MLQVEVVYARADEQIVERVTLARGATVAQALTASGLLTRFPEITHAPLNVGIYGVRVPLEHPLTDGDRVEIYRPLKVDPKEMRRQRVRARRKL